MVLNMTLLGTQHKLQMTSPGKVASVLSTGIRGATRHTCGAESNPEGVFLKVSADGTLLDKTAAVGNLTFSNTNPAYFTGRLQRDNNTLSAKDYPPVLESLLVIIQVCEKTLQCLKSELMPYLNPDDLGRQSLLSDLEEAVSSIRAKAKAVYLQNTSSELLDFLTLSGEVANRVSMARTLTQRLKRQFLLTFQSYEMSYLEGNVTSLTQVSAEFVSKVVHHSSSDFGKVSELAIKSTFEITVLGRVLRIHGEFWHNVAGLMDTCKKTDVLHGLEDPPAALIVGVILSSGQAEHSSPWLESIWDRLKIQDVSSVRMIFSDTSEFVIELEVCLLSLGKFPGTKLIINHNGLSLETTGLLWDSFPVSLSGFALTEQQSPDSSWSVPLTGKFVSFEEDSFDGQLEHAVRQTVKDLTQSLSTRLQVAKYNLKRARAAHQEILNKFERAEQELSDVERFSSSMVFTLPAEVSVQDLLHYLDKISDYRTVCNCSPCSSACLGGSQIEVCEEELNYPCLFWTDCAHQAINLTCVLHNVACFGVLKSALSRRNGSEETVLIGRLQGLIEDASVQQMVDEENKFQKERAQIKKKLLTYHLDECTKDIDNLERHLKVIREENIHLLYLQDLIKRNGLRAVIKVTDCGFETTTREDNFHKIDVHCIINPFLVGQRFMTFALNLGKAQSGVWDVAQGLVSDMLNTVQNSLTNVKSYSATDKYLYQSIKEHLFTKTPTIHVDVEESKWENDCRQAEDVLSFLDTSVGVLKQVTSSLSQANVLTKKLASFPNSLPLRMSLINDTAAWFVYDLAKPEIRRILKSINPQQDKVVKKIKQLYTFAKEKTTSSIEFVQDVPFVTLWQTMMDARIKTQFNFTLCSGFSDCVKRSLFHLTELTRAADPQATTQALQTTWSISKGFSAILTSNSYSPTKLHEAVERLQNQILTLKKQQLFCPAIFSTEAIDDVVVVERGASVDLSCPVRVDLVSSVDWLRDSSRPVAIERDLILTLSNVSLADTGSYTCTVHSYSGFHTSSPIQLVVRHTLAFTSSLPLKYQAVEGDTVRVDCGSVGTPPRETVWKTNSGSDPEPGEELVLKNISNKASGIYRCEVSNNHGSLVSDEMFLAVWKAQPICPTVRYRFSYISGPKVFQNEQMAKHQATGTMQEEFSRALSAVFHDKSNTFFLYNVSVFEDRWLGEFSVRSISCQRGGFCERQRCEIRYREELDKLQQFLTVFQAVRGSVFLFEANHMYYYFNSAYYDVIRSQPVCPEGQKKAGDFICVLTENGIPGQSNGAGIPYPIGQPANLTLAVDHISWNPPVNGMSFVKGYHVLVMDVRLAMTVIVNVTTTELRYSLPFDVTSGHYEVSISAFSRQHKGEPASLTTETPRSDEQNGLVCRSLHSSGIACGFDSYHLHLLAIQAKKVSNG
ncbi:uncharacterized protein LOC135465945 [Liolophura sinensis]|uniref:uncharacterized protein LOC135465945 n=1 Tax=Liolophura sinensis TaxID=3198878 RepID=UPI00315804FE